MTRDANPPILKPMHTLEIRMPIELADRLIAKAGSMDEAVNQALTAFLKTDIATRNQRIKEFVEMGRDIDKLAEFHGLTPDDILEIAGK
jgi:hypothetical protein